MAKRIAVLIAGLVMFSTLGHLALRQIDAESRRPVTYCWTEPNVSEPGNLEFYCGTLDKRSPMASAGFPPYLMASIRARLDAGITLQEDDPGWNCHVMGNGICGPSPEKVWTTNRG